MTSLLFIAILDVGVGCLSAPIVIVALYFQRLKKNPPTAPLRPPAEVEEDDDDRW